MSQIAIIFTYFNTKSNSIDFSQQHDWRSTQWSCNHKVKCHVPLNEGSSSKWWMKDFKISAIFSSMGLLIALNPSVCKGQEIPMHRPEVPSCLILMSQVRQWQLISLAAEEENTEFSHLMMSHSFGIAVIFPRICTCDEMTATDQQVTSSSTIAFLQTFNNESRLFQQSYSINKTG